MLVEPANVSLNVLAVISSGLKVLFERVGKPEIVNRPNLFRSGGAGVVIACNHVGWADNLWMAYAVTQDSSAVVVPLQAASHGRQLYRPGSQGRQARRPRPLLQQTSNHYSVAMRISARRVIVIMPSASYRGAL